jgi:RNA recognition motif-containing protein
MGTKLYVGNLPFDVSEGDLKELFAEAGTVDSVAIIQDKFSGQSRGFGFVEMGTDEEAEAAIQRFDGHDLKGRTMKVNEARPQRDRMGGGGGGRGRGGGRGGGGGGGRRDW